MNQTEKNKITIELKENIELLKNTINYQEKTLIQLLEQLDNINNSNDNIKNKQDLD